MVRKKVLYPNEQPLLAGSRHSLGDTLNGSCWPKSAIRVGRQELANLYESSSLLPRYSHYLVYGGAGAKNCGFFNLVLDEDRAKAESGGIKCARQAYDGGTPFKFGTVRLPTDSYDYEVLVRSSTGDNWLIVYDIMVDGTDPQTWFKKFESIKFRGRSLGY